MDMMVDFLRSQLEVTKEDIELVIIMGLYLYRYLIGSPSTLIKKVYLNDFLVNPPRIIIWGIKIQKDYKSQHYCSLSYKDSIHPLLKDYNSPFKIKI